MPITFRRPFERLQRGGKRVVAASLALPTLERERARGARRSLEQSGFDVEINDLTLMGVAGDDALLGRSAGQRL